MNGKFKIVNSELADLVDIIRWFDASVIYQEKKGYTSWRNYDQDALRRDIENKNHYKALNENGTGIVFSVSYSDQIIWAGKDDGLSIYLHRIVVNPDFKGQKMFGVILDWAIDHIKQKQLRNIRMDTWTNNPGIIDYYKTFGFKVVGNVITPDTEELPVHNRKLDLTLMEYRGLL